MISGSVDEDCPINMFAFEAEGVSGNWKLVLISTKFYALLCEITLKNFDLENLSKKPKIDYFQQYTNTMTWLFTQITL